MIVFETKKMILLSIYLLNQIIKFKSIVKMLVYLGLLLTLSGCNDFKPPIEADDFGFPKITVYSIGQNVQGQKENELSEWTFSGYAYNGELATIMVYNMDRNNYYYVWSSWFGGGSLILTDSMKSSTTPLCCFGGNYDSTTGECTGAKYCSTPSGDSNTSGKYENIVNAPCIFSQGQGLYLLLTDPSNKSVTDPNSYANINRNPSSVNFFTLAMWQYTGMYQNGELANGYIGGYVDNQAVSYSKESNVPSGQAVPSTTSYTSMTIPSANIGGDAYFKILDRYYDDNSGFYQVSLKNGFSSKVPPPIARVISLVTLEIKAASQMIFNNIVQDGHYKVSIRAAITIYIIVSGMLFLAGVIRMTQVELINRMIRLIIVIQLLTTNTSWDVFNNYFFRFFTDGINEIINIITHNILGSYAGTNGLTFFDAIIDLLFSYETTMKIVALIVSIPSGIIAIIIIYLAFALFAKAIVEALILYLLAYIATSLLISMAPIFISFLLFETTRSIFQQWIKQLVGYFFQPMLVFAALSMMGQTIINSMYRLLGYKVCYNPWVTASGNTIFKMWQICSSLQQKAVIPIPGYGFWDPLNPDTFYGPYEFRGERYIDLPFLIPQSGTAQNDQALIEALASPGAGLNMPILYNSFMLLLMTLLLSKFYTLVPMLARGLSGLSDDQGPDSGIAGVARSSFRDMQNVFHQFDNEVTNRFKKTAVGKSIYKMRGKITDLFKDIEPEKQNKGAVFFKSVVGGVGSVGNSIFRTFIPVGSLKTTPEREEFKRQHQKKYGKITTAQSLLGGVVNKIGNAAYRKITGEKMEDVNKKAAEFDKKVNFYKNMIRDKVGGKIDPFIGNLQKGLKDAAHPLNLIDHKYVRDNLRTPMEKLDQKSLYKAILRHLGVLEQELFVKRYGKEGATRLTPDDRKSIEASLSWDDIKDLVKKAPEDKMLETLRKIDKLNKGANYSMLDHYRDNILKEKNNSEQGTKDRGTKNRPITTKEGS